MKTTAVPAPAAGEGSVGAAADGGENAGEGAAGAGAEGSAAPGDSASGADLGSGPPPIVSLDEMARAESAEKKRQRKAKPAGKKVGWADRAGRTLQVRGILKSCPIFMTNRPSAERGGADGREGEHCQRSAAGDHR